MTIENKYKNGLDFYEVEKIVSSNNKKVYLIGDLIRVGYQEYTKKALEDVAQVCWPNMLVDNVQSTVVRFGYWMTALENTEDISVVVFNSGRSDCTHYQALWDYDKACYYTKEGWEDIEDVLNDESVYSEMLVRTYEKIKRFLPNAKIVFATTTPMNPNGDVGPNPCYDEDVQRYNEIAKSVLTPLGCEILDHYEFCKNFTEKDYINHFELTSSAYEKLGKYTAEFIKKYL